MKAYATAAALLLFAGTAQAQVTETTDAGQTLGTAQDTQTGTGMAITSISGTISTINDADLFKIYIDSPSTFSAIVTGNPNPDTELFLLDSTGHAIAANDDASGTNYQAALAAGNSNYANLSAGTYYLGISNSGNEPVNLNNQLLFAGYPGGDTTATRGPASGVTPTTLSDFDSNAGGTADVGSYNIALTGVTTGAATAPEPSTWLLMGGGTFAAGAVLRRRRRKVATMATA